MHIDAGPTFVPNRVVAVGFGSMATFRRWSTIRSVATLGACLVLSACSSPAPEAPQERATIEGPQFYTQNEEYLVELAACLEQDGYEVAFERSEFNAGTGLAFPGVPSEQQSELNNAIKLCGEQIGPIALPIHEEAFQQETYAWLVGQRRCLEEAGYQMPAAPSYAVFVEQMRTTGFPQWSPIADATGSSDDPANQAGALRACPMTTETW